METLISAADLRTNNFAEAQWVEVSRLMREMKKIQREEPSRQFMVVSTLAPDSIRVFRDLGYVVEKREDHMYGNIWVISWKI